MQFSLPIPTLFTQVFGISGALVKSYKIPDADRIGENVTDVEKLQSPLGTVVQFPMAFTGNENYNYRKDGKVLTKFMKGMYLPYTSVASFSRAKRITETFMSGQKGSIIEEYGFEPWEIRVQGFILKNEGLTSGGGLTVEDQVREMQEWEELSDAIKVKGEHFELLNIHRLALLSITYPEARGSNIDVVRPFEMRLRSVEAIELILP